VPPGGSLIRTSVMATHERGHLDRALEIFASVRDQVPDT
jgi:8-amino-7-oxononanoate synthase